MLNRSSLRPFYLNLDGVATTTGMIKMTTPIYTTITRIEINLLLEHKAPRCCFPVISAINSYMFDTYNSFPSIKTIIDWCGNHISKSGVEKALRWLEKHKIITRGKARTKTRFTNKIRKMVYGAKECLQSVSNPKLTECKHHDKNKGEKNYFYKKNKQNGNSNSKWVKPKANRKTPRSGFSKVRRFLSFDGGVDASEAIARNGVDEVKEKFKSFIKQPRQMEPAEATMFQMKLKEDRDWGYFVLGYHPYLWKQITGIRPVPDEIEHAKHQLYIQG